MYDLTFFTRLTIIGMYVITWLTGFVMPLPEMDIVINIFVLLNFLWCFCNIVVACSPPNYSPTLIGKSMIVDLAIPWVLASLLLKYFHHSIADGSSLFGVSSFWFIFGASLLLQKMINIHE